MTPPSIPASGPHRATQPITTEDPPCKGGGFTWEAFGKILLAIVGSLLAISFTSFRNEMERMKIAVYSTQERATLVEEKIKTLQKDQESTEKRVELLEGTVYRGKR